jgi:hypothetical protein
MTKIHLAFFTFQKMEICNLYICIQKLEFGHRSCLKIQPIPWLEMVLTISLHVERTLEAIKWSGTLKET